MVTKSSTFRNSMLLKIAIATVMVLNILTLNEYHFSGDDHAIYLSQAEQMANGSLPKLLHDNTQMMQECPFGPYLYPFGYPLILAPFFWLTTPGLLTCKLITVFICYVGMVFLFKILRILKVGYTLSLGVILLTLMSPLTVNYFNVLGSDLPALTLNLICIYLYLVILKSQQYTGRMAVLLSVLLMLAIFTRTSGIVISIAITLVSFSYIKGRTKQLIVHLSIIHLPTIVAFVCNKYFLLSRNENEWFVLEQSNMFDTITRQVPYYLGLLTEPFRTSLFLPAAKLLGLSQSLGENKILNYAIVLLVLSFYVFMGFRALRRIKLTSSVSFILLVCLGIVGFYCLWPARQGERFIFLIYPFLLSFLLVQLNKLSSFVRRAAIGIVALLILYRSTSNYTASFSVSDEIIYENEGWEGSSAFKGMINCLKELSQNKDNAYIGFQRPRTIYRYTGKVSFCLREKTLPILDLVVIIPYDTGTVVGKSVMRDMKFVNRFGPYSIYSK